jgi:hypothetical protein
MSQATHGLAVGPDGDTYWIVGWYTEQQIAVGEFTGDGLPDLLVATYGGVEIQPGVMMAPSTTPTTPFFPPPATFKLSWPQPISTPTAISTRLRATGTRALP